MAKPAEDIIMAEPVEDVAVVEAEPTEDIAMAEAESAEDVSPVPRAHGRCRARRPQACDAGDGVRPPGGRLIQGCVGDRNL
jgi:hypothetical protein